MAQTRHLNHISQLCIWVSRRAIREGVRDTLKGEVCAVSSYEHLDWRTITFTTQGDLHWPTELGEHTSVVRVGDLRSQSPTVNREKVTKGRQLSNVRDFARCHGVLPLGACCIPSLSTAWSSS